MIAIHRCKRAFILFLPLLITCLIAESGGADREPQARAAGKNLSRTCTACHGKKGISKMSMYPNLAGQKANYLIRQMKAFRDGKRNSPMMQAPVKRLSNTDIANLAAFYAGLEHAPANQAFAGGDVLAGKKLARKCMACHGEKGISKMGMYPNLVGQKAKYLIRQMKACRDGKRNSPMMQAPISGLSNTDIANLATYYAGLDP